MPSTTEKQAHFMSAIAHGWHPTGMKHPPLMAVAKEFHEADKRVGKWMHAEGGKVGNLERLFAMLADMQRGKPERAMLRAQDIGSTARPYHESTNAWTYALEHVGDLTHRMSEQPYASKATDWGLEYVAPKVRTGLRVTTNPVDTRNILAIPSDHPVVDAGLQYSVEHGKLPVYNDAQWHAREAARALGGRELESSTFHLKALQDLIDSGKYPEIAGSLDEMYKPKFGEGGKVAGMRELIDQLTRLWHKADMAPMTPEDIETARKITRTLPEYGAFQGEPMKLNDITSNVHEMPPQQHAEGGKVDNLRRIFDWIALKYGSNFKPGASPLPYRGVYGENQAGYRDLLQKYNWNPRMTSTHFDMMEDLVGAPSQWLTSRRGTRVTLPDLHELVNKYGLTLEDPLKTYRGMTVQAGSLPERGSFVTRPHMQSISTDPDLARVFADPLLIGEQDRLSTLTNIYHEPGTRVLPQPNSGQSELLLAPGERGGLHIEDLMDTSLEGRDAVLIDASHRKTGYQEGGKVSALKALAEMFVKSTEPYTHNQENIRGALNEAHSHLFTDPNDPNFKAAAARLEQVPGSGRAVQRLQDYMELGAFDNTGFHKNELLNEMAGLGSAHGLDVNPEVLSTLAPADATGGGLLKPETNPLLQPDHTRKVSGYDDGGQVSQASDQGADWATIMARARQLNQPTIQGKPDPNPPPPAPLPQAPPAAQAMEQENLTPMERMSPALQNEIQKFYMQNESSIPQIQARAKAMQALMAERIRSGNMQNANTIAAASGFAEGGEVEEGEEVQEPASVALAMKAPRVGSLLRFRASLPRLQQPRVTQLAHAEPAMMAEGGSVEDTNYLASLSEPDFQEWKARGEKTPVIVTPGESNSAGGDGPAGPVTFHDDRTATDKWLGLIGTAADRATTRIAGDDAHRTLARLGAGLSSQIVGVDEKGHAQLGKMPGIANETMSLPAGIADLASGLSQGPGQLVDKYLGTSPHPLEAAAGPLAAPLTGLRIMRGGVGLIDALNQKYGSHLDWSRRAAEEADRTHRATREAMGLPKPKGLQEQGAEALGTMLGQIPLGPEKAGQSLLSKALKSPIEWFGPTIRPSLRNYGLGAGAGAVMGRAAEDNHPHDWDYPGATGSWAEGGKVRDLGAAMETLNKMFRKSLADEQLARGPTKLTVPKTPTLSGTQRDLGPVRTSAVPTMDDIMAPGMRRGGRRRVH